MMQLRTKLEVSRFIHSKDVEGGGGGFQIFKKGHVTRATPTFEGILSFVG